MNWIEIDKILHNIINRHDNLEDAYQEAEKQFKWNRSQSKAAIDPLLKRHTFNKDIAKEPANSSNKLTKTRKRI
jgi:hypothetical protein